MSIIKIQGNVSGTGTLTIAAPNTNSDFTMNLPASNGTVPILGSATNNGVVFIDGSGQMTSGSALTFNGTKLSLPTVLAIKGAQNSNISKIAMTRTDASYSINNETDLRFYGQTTDTESPANILHSMNTGGTFVWNNGSGSEQMRLTSTGLGIGTSSPAQKLNVVGNVLIEPSAAFGYVEIKNQTSTAGSVLRFTNGSTTSYFGKENSTGTYTWSSGGTAYATVISAYGSTAPIQFGHNTPSMTLDSSGNVGIGTSSPGVKFDVAGAIRSYIAGGTPIIYLNNGVTQHSIQNVSDTLVFTNDGVSKMAINGSNLQFNSGYGSVATAYGCRAWVNFNGQGTVAIRGSGNVSSITDNGTADYTVNFTTAMPDANYATNATMPYYNTNASQSGNYFNQGAVGVVYQATSSVRVNSFTGTNGGTYYDSPNVSVTIFR